MEAGLRALAELEEEAKDLQKQHVANRRQLRENAIEAQRDRLAASIARKTDKITRFETAKQVRHLAWQQNQKTQRTAEYNLKLRLEEETKQRRRKMIDRAKQTTQRRKPKARPKSAPLDSPLLRELSLADSASVRDALMGIAESEEESQELRRIFEKIGAGAKSDDEREGSEPGTVSTILEGPVCYDAKLTFKQKELECSLTLQNGCTELRCAGMMPEGTVAVKLEQSMPLGRNALNWLAAGSGLRHDSEKGCVGACGCVLSLQCAELREYLEDKIAIGVSHLTSTRAAHLVPCSSHALDELLASGVQLGPDFNPEADTVLVIVREAAQRSRAATPARPSTSEASATHKREEKLKARYTTLLEEAIEAGTQRKPRACKETQERGEMAGELLELGETNPMGGGLLELKQELMRTAEVDEVERLIFQKLLIKLMAGRNPTQLFWEINRAHDGFVSLSEWRRAVMELGVKLDPGCVKESFERMAEGGKRVNHKALQGKLREYQTKLYGQKKNYWREWHQKGGHDPKANAKKLPQNLYNPKPYSGTTTGLSFSFKGAS